MAIARDFFVSSTRGRVKQGSAVERAPEENKAYFKS